MVGLDLIDVQVACRRHKCRCVVVDKVVDTEIATVRIAERLEECCLCVMTLLEQADHLFGLLLLGDNRFVGSDELAHLRIDSGDHLLGDGHIRAVEVPQRAIVTAGYWVLHAQVGTRIERTYRVSHHHLQRTHVAAHTFRTRRIDKLDVLGLIDEERQVLNLVIDSCGYHGVRQLQTNLVIDVQKRSTTLDVVVLLVVFAVNGDSIFHTLEIFVFFWHLCVFCSVIMHHITDTPFEQVLRGPRTSSRENTNLLKTNPKIGLYSYFDKTKLGQM